MLDGESKGAAGPGAPADRSSIPGTQTLARGLALLEAVATGVTEMRGLVARTGIGRSTAHRLLQYLVRERYLRRSPESVYALGPKLVQLGFQALQTNPLATVARRHLEELRARVHDTVHLGIEDAGEVLYLAKLPGSRGAEMRSRIGMRQPMTRTGLGRAMLLDSPESWVRVWHREAGSDGAGEDEAGARRFVAEMRGFARAGAAFDLEENEPGICCVAAPVRDATGAICAAVSVTATRPYMSGARMRDLVPLVRGTADDIGAELGYRAASPR